MDQRMYSRGMSASSHALNKNSTMMAKHAEVVKQYLDLRAMANPLSLPWTLGPPPSFYIRTGLHMLTEICSLSHTPSPNVTLYTYQQ